MKRGLEQKKYFDPIFRFFGRGRHALGDGGIVPKIVVGGVEMFLV
jgi:hypothetical protein